MRSHDLLECIMCIQKQEDKEKTDVSGSKNVEIELNYA